MQGVSSAFGVTASNPFTSIGGIAARTTVQGAVQALMGGKFADGALAGLASGLAEAVSANMLEGIANSGMTGAEAVAARTLARVIGSAIRAAASPGDAGQAFASAFLDDVFKQIDTGTPITQTAFDEEGRLNLGIVDPQRFTRATSAAVGGSVAKARRSCGAGELDGAASAGEHR